jgi:hypothetical protein
MSTDPLDIVFNVPSPPVHHGERITISWDQLTRITGHVKPIVLEHWEFDPKTGKTIYHGCDAKPRKLCDKDEILL